MTTLESPTTKPCPGKRKENTQEQAPSIPNPCHDRVHESTPSPFGEFPVRKTRWERQASTSSKTTVIPGAVFVQAQPCFQTHKQSCSSCSVIGRTSTPGKKRQYQKNGNKTDLAITAFHVVTHPHSRCLRSPPPTCRHGAHPRSSRPYAAHPHLSHLRSRHPPLPAEHHEYGHRDRV